MRIATGILGAFVALSALTAAHADNNCLDQGLNDQIQAKLTLETSDLAQYDRCQANTRTYKALQALQIIKTIQFSQNSSAKPYNQQILPNDFWGYFSQRANTIHEEAACDKGILAFVYGFAHDGVIHVCPALFDDQVSKYERAETMLHEARHFEGYTHVTCSRGPRNGEAGACDDSVDELGSYAVTVEALTKMAMDSKDIPAEQKTMVKILALTYANEVFNTPISTRDLSAFYLVGNDHKGYIYSDKGLVQVASLEGDKILSRGSALAVFPKDKGNAYTVNVFTPDLTPSPPMGTFSASYNAMPEDQRPTLVDIMNLGYVNGSVTTTEVAGMLRDATNNTVVKLDTPAKAAYSAAEVGQTDQDSIYVVNTNNEMQRIQFLADDQYQIQAIANPLAGLQSVAVFNSQRVALTDGGQVVIEDSGKWAAFTPLAKLQFTQMTRPFLWDQYFEDGAATSVMF